MRIKTALALFLSVAAGFVAASMKPHPAAACWLEGDCRESCDECTDAIGYEVCWACAGVCDVHGEVVFCG
jgi:hypothetical protein